MNKMSLKYNYNLKKPYIHAIKIHKDYDDQPDLSYLEKSTDKRDIERLQDYWTGNYWHMIGIYATTDILIPYGDYVQIIPIRTGGLWSIESDSDPEYIKEIISDQIEQLEDILKRLHVRIPKDYVKIED
jgi:hypothetical protein